MRRIPHVTTRNKKSSTTTRGRRSAKGRGARGATRSARSRSARHPAGRSPTPRTGLLALKHQIDGLLKKEAQNTGLRVKICNHFHKAYLRFLSEADGDHTAAARAYDAWCLASFKVSPTWARIRREIGAARIPYRLIRGRCFSIEVLHLIIKAPQLYQEILFRLGSGLSLGDLRAARDSAISRRTDEEARAGLEQELVRLKKGPAPAPAAAGPEPGSPDPAGPAPTGKPSRRDRPTLADMLTSDQDRVDRDMQRVHKRMARVKSLRKPDLEAYRSLRKSVLAWVERIDRGLGDELQAPAAAAAQQVTGASGPDTPADSRKLPRDDPGDSPSGDSPPPTRGPIDREARSAAVIDQRPPRVKAPYLLSPDDEALPVGYPGFPPSPFELLTCEIIVAASALEWYARRLKQGRRQQCPLVSKLLMLRTNRAAARFHDASEQTRPLTREAAAQGLAYLQERAGEGSPLPLPVHTAFHEPDPPDLHPIAWVVVLVRDPLDDPAPEPLEPLLWRLLGALDALHGRMDRWLAERQAGQRADCALLCQLERALKGAHTALYMIRAEFHKGAQEAALYEAETGCTQARLDVPLSAQPDPRILLVGSDVMVPALARLGLDWQGRHLALSLFTSQLVMALGGRGWGKSHLGRLIAECLHLHLPGINQLPYPLRSATFELDYNLGPGRRQMLRGLFPNPYPQQLEQLHAHFATRVTNAAFRQGILRCMPQALPGLRRELAPYVERGLIIEPLELGPQNLTQTGWEAILGAAFQQGVDRPAYADHLAALIGLHGGRLMPQALIGMIEEDNEFARVRGKLIRQLLPLCGLVRPGAEVRDDLKQGCPVFYLLECQHAPESFLLGLLMAVMHGLGQATGRPEDEIMLWLFCDELSKLVKLPVVGKLLEAMARELRHRQVSLFLGGQTPTGLSADFLGLVSVMFLYQFANQAAFGPLRELDYCRGMRPESLREARRGRPLMGAVESTDPLVQQAVQPVWLRPTFIDAGGESLTLR